jgi:hypothetical protein
LIADSDSYISVAANNSILAKDWWRPTLEGLEGADSEAFNMSDLLEFVLATKKH